MTNPIHAEILARGSCDTGPLTVPPHGYRLFTPRPLDGGPRLTLFVKTGTMPTLRKGADPVWVTDKCGQQFLVAAADCGGAARVVVDPVPMYRELPVAKTDPVADSEGAPTVGFSHPRAGEWMAAVSFGNTVLGLVDWLEANPAKPVRQGHTHGPLFAESPTRVCLRVAGGLSPHVARTDTEDMPLALQRANARRIVACWNACSEIETAELEGSYLLHQRDNVYTLASQR